MKMYIHKKKFGSGDHQKGISLSGGIFMSKINSSIFKLRSYRQKDLKDHKKTKREKISVCFGVV